MRHWVWLSRTTPWLWNEFLTIQILLWPITEISAYEGDLLFLVLAAPSPSLSELSLPEDDPDSDDPLSAELLSWPELTDPPLLLSTRPPLPRFLSLLSSSAEKLKHKTISHWEIYFMNCLVNIVHDHFIGFAICDWVINSKTEFNRVGSLDHWLTCPFEVVLMVIHPSKDPQKITNVRKITSIAIPIAS